MSSALPRRRYIEIPPQTEANSLHGAIPPSSRSIPHYPKAIFFVFFTGQDLIDAAQENLQETARALGNKIQDYRRRASPDFRTNARWRKKTGARYKHRRELPSGAWSSSMPGSSRKNPRTGFLDRDSVFLTINHRASQAGCVEPERLTKLGRWVAEFPVDLILSRAIVSSEKYFCTDKTKHVETSFAQFKSLSWARDIRDQLAGLCEHHVEVVVQSNPDANDISAVQKAITPAYFYNTAQLQKSGDSYRTLKMHHTMCIHPSSSIFQHQPPIRTVLYYELVMTSKSYMRQVLFPHNNLMISSVAPHYFKAADLEQLTTGDKKLPNAKAVDSSGAAAS
ncbi:hypothetical protein DFH29DRAFT_1084722 [Suillus ampliporus]|nr:hypothetical protein DFH29DRAFT_1084722 [Suillus ampliporus]